jgi:DNA-binding XRE family transcriptional regulator
MDTRPWEKSETAERFKALRRKARIKQSHLAEIIGICRQSISEIENARVMPHPSTWNHFCELEARHNQPKIDLSGNWLREFISEISAQKGDIN